MPITSVVDQSSITSVSALPAFVVCSRTLRPCCRDQLDAVKVVELARMRDDDAEAESVHGGWEM